MAAKTPKLRRNATGKTKPKAIGKANPTTPQDRTAPGSINNMGTNRSYAWGGKQVKGAPSTRSTKGKPYGS